MRGVGQAELDVAGVEVLERGGLVVVGRRGGSRGSGGGSGSGSRLGLGGSGASASGARRRGDGGLEEVGVAQRAVELAGVRVAGRMTTSSSSGRAAAAAASASGSRSGSWRGRGGGRSVRVVSTTCSPVARSTPATDAPVSSSRAAQKRKMAMMCAPTSENRRVAASAMTWPRCPPRSATGAPSPGPKPSVPTASPRQRGARAGTARPRGTGARRGQRRAHDEQGAGGHERDRRRLGDAPDRPREAVDDRLAGLAAVPAAGRAGRRGRRRRRPGRGR